MGNWMLQVECLSTGAGFEGLRFAIGAGFKACFFTSIKEKAAMIPADIEKNIRIEICDTQDYQSLRTKIIELNSSEGIAGILCAQDDCIENVAKVAASLGFPFTSDSAVRCSKDKPRMKELARIKGIPVARGLVVQNTKELCNAGESLQFPVFVRPANGSGSMNAQICHNSSALMEYANSVLLQYSGNFEILVEEVLYGPLVSVEAITVNGVTEILGLSDRTLGAQPYAVEIEATFPCDFGGPVSSKITQWTKELLVASAFDNGLSHTEFIVTREGPYFIELNPRLGGALLGKAISEALKIDVYAIQVDFALGKPVSFTHELPEIAVCMSIMYNTSTLNSLNNDELMQILERHPGQNTFQPNPNRSATALMQPKDFRGFRGIMLTRGESPELAKAQARAILSHLG